MTDLLVNAQGAAGDAGGALLQYGALGAVAMLAIYAVAKLFAVNKTASDAAIVAERARADRLEKQLADLNAAVIDKFLPATLHSTQVTSDLVSELRKGAQRGGT